MKTLLDNINESDVKNDYFPYVAKKNILDQSLADSLRDAYPSIKDILDGRQGISSKEDLPNNSKLRYYAADILNSNHIDSLWKEFVSAHLTKDYLKKFLKVFSSTLYERHPHLKSFFDRIDDLKVGIRKIDTFDTCDVLLDAELCIDTPVTGNPSSVKIAHLDNEHKVAVGLFYLRDPKDNSQGGSLEFYTHKDKNKSKFHGPRLINSEYVNRIDSLPYQDNCFAMFCNSLDSLHGVSIREKTSHPRYSFNTVIEIKDPLFDLGLHYKVTPFNLLARRIKRLIKKIKK